jgi:hypothetical protein
MLDKMRTFLPKPNFLAKIGTWIDKRGLKNGGFEGNYFFFLRRLSGMYGHAGSDAYMSLV